MLYISRPVAETRKQSFLHFCLFIALEKPLKIFLIFKKIAILTTKKIKYASYVQAKLS